MRGVTPRSWYCKIYTYIFLYIFIIYLYYSFVCSQNEKAVQTFKRLVPNALPGTLRGVLICTESPPCGWTWPCLVQDWLLCHSALSFPCPALHSLSLTLYFPFTKCPDIIWACLKRAELCLSNATEHQLPLFVLRYHDTPPLSTFWKNLGSPSLCLGMARPWDMHTPCRLEESQTG